MGLFGSRKIDDSELQECLACFEAESGVIAFQTREADLYNKVLAKYGFFATLDPLAADKVRKAASRLAQAATEILQRHKEIKNVPIAATAMHSAWHVTFLANEAWASATAAAVEEITKGLNPNAGFIQNLFEEYNNAWRGAHEQDKKFVKRIKAGREDIAKILARANADATLDYWEPQM